MALIKSPGGILVPTTTAWDFDQTAGEWLDADANFFTGKPFTVGVIEYRRQANGTNLWSVAGEFSVFNTSDLYYFWIDGHTITVSAPVDTRWHSIVCREVANNDHRIRVSGTEATSTTNKPNADPTAAAISVGNFNSGAGTRIDAIVARVAFWDTTLTDAEVALFEAGVPPGEIRPGKLLSWLEFDSPHLDRIERIPGVTWSWNSGSHEPFIASTNPISRKRLDPILFYSVDGGDTNVSAGVDALVLTEYAASVALDVNVSAGVDALTLTEYAATVSIDTNVNAGVDALTLTEQAASIALDVNVSAGVDALTLTEYAASISGDTNVSAGVDALTLTEHAASIVFDVNVSAAVDALTLTEYAASISEDVNVSAGVDALTLTEYAASISEDVNVSSSVDALTLTEYAASISTGTRTAVAQDTTLTPGQTVTVDLTSFGGAPTGATIDGVAVTISNATASSVDVTAPALSTFVSAGTHATTRWNTNITLEVSEAGGSATDTIQIVEPESAGPTYWFGQAGATPYPSDSVLPAATAQNDDYFVEETLGDVFAVSTTGIVVLNTTPSTVEARIFDVSAGSWSTVEEHQFLTNPDISAGVATLTLTEYAATINNTMAVSAGVQNLTLTEYAAMIGLGQTIAAGVDSLTLTEQASTITFDWSAVISYDALTLTERAATISLVGSDPWTVQSEESTTWSDQADDATVWTEQSDVTTTWSI